MELIVISGVGTSVLLFALFLDFLLPHRFALRDRAAGAFQDPGISVPTAAAAQPAELRTYDRAA